MADKILIADDSLTIQKVVAITLANEPWTLVEATDESELLGKIRSGDYKLVLLDFNLSETKSGFELVKEVKAIANHVPVLALLGTFDSVEESELFSSGFSGKIVKPFDSTKFINKCRELVNGSDISLSAEEEESLDFSDSGDDASEWVMDSSQVQMNNHESEDSWDEETSPGVSFEENDHASKLEKELSSWGVDIPAPIHANDKMESFHPPVIEGETETKDETVNEDAFEVKFDGGQQSQDEDSLFPTSNDLDYPDLGLVQSEETEEEEFLSSTQSNLISIDELMSSEDDLPLKLESKPEEYREDLAKDIESELSPDDFWAIDDDVNSVEKMGMSVDLEDDSRESFVVGVGDPLAPVDPVKPQDKPQYEVERVVTQVIDEDAIVNKILVKIEPLLESMMKKLIDEKIEKVAWEVIPDVAENLIRKEIKEISSQSKHS